MMRAKKISSLLFFCCFALISIPVKAQTNRVEIKFEIDGQEVVGQKFKVQFYIDNQIIEPKLTKKGFIVPEEVKQHKQVGVRFVSGRYDLYFDSVNSFDFEGAWIIGIDNPPFVSEHILIEPNSDEELLGVYYIKFIPKDAASTMIAVQVYR